MNEMFAYNGVAQTHMAPKWMNEDLRAKQMICSLFAIVEDRLEKNEKHREFKREREGKLTNLTFESALEFINTYTESRRINVSRALP